MRRILFGAAAIAASRLLAFFPTQRTTRFFQRQSGLVLVMCCSDNRVDEYDIIREEHGLRKGECFPWIRPGGPSLLLHVKSEGEKKGIIRDIQKIAIEEKKCTRAIAAFHQDCAGLALLGLTDEHQGKHDAPVFGALFHSLAPSMELLMPYYPLKDKRRGIFGKPEYIVVKHEIPQQADEPTLALG